jgi:hypothetical protein
MLRMMNVKTVNYKERQQDPADYSSRLCHNLPNQRPLCPAFFRRWLWGFGFASH